MIFNVTRNFIPSNTLPQSTQNKTTIDGLEPDTFYDLASYLLIPSEMRALKSTRIQVKTLTTDTVPSEITHAREVDESLNMYNKLDLNVVWQPVEGNIE